MLVQRLLNEFSIKERKRKARDRRDAERDFLFPVPSLYGSGDFRKMPLFVPEKLFWMIYPRFLSSNFPKKSFSGTNNAKILQKSPPPKTYREQEKENLEIHWCHHPTVQVVRTLQMFLIRSVIDLIELNLHRNFDSYGAKQLTIYEERT
jgi:hypothetical protein